MFILHFNAGGTIDITMHKAEIAADQTVSLDESTFREMVLEVSFTARSVVQAVLI
jgi:sialic acid synthase SpsE